MAAISEETGPTTLAYICWRLPYNFHGDGASDVFHNTHQFLDGHWLNSKNLHHPVAPEEVIERVEVGAVWGPADLGSAADAASRLAFEKVDDVICCVRCSAILLPPPSVLRCSNPNFRPDLLLHYCEVAIGGDRSQTPVVVHQQISRALPWTFAAHAMTFDSPYNFFVGMPWTPNAVGMWIWLRMQTKPFFIRPNNFLLKAIGLWKHPVAELTQSCLFWSVSQLTRIIW